MTQAYSVLGMTVYPYGLVAGCAMLVYLAVCGVARYRARLSVGTARVYGVLAFPLGLIFARLLFCLFSLSEFRDGDGIIHFEWMLRFWDGGYSLIGLMAGLMLAALFAARIQRERFGRVADMAVVPMGILITALRLAEGLINSGEGEALIGYGKYVSESSLTSAAPILFLTEALGGSTMYMPAVYRIEAFVGILLLIIMLVCYFAPKKPRFRAGDMALLFFSLFGASQVLLEYLRNDAHMWLNFAVRGSQILSALMPLFATIILSSRVRRITGKRLAPAMCVILCVLALATVALMEFSIDGRITLGAPNQLRDYIIMAASCLVMALLPVCLLCGLIKKVYRQDAFGAKIR